MTLFAFFNNEDLATKNDVAFWGALVSSLVTADGSPIVASVFAVMALWLLWVSWPSHHNP